MEEAGRRREGASWSDGSCGAWPGGRGGVQGRTFEAAACGAFQLVDDRPSLYELFDPPNDLVTYSDTEELVELVRHYSDRPDERRLRAEKSRRRVLDEHTYAKRLGGMIELVTGSA